MKAVCLAVLVIASPTLALAQSKPPKAARDICAPIGKTADGKLVYAMACNAMPAPPPPPVAAAPPPPPPEPEVERSGLFGLSYTRKPPTP